MRFLLGLALLLSISGSGVAQEQKRFRPTPSSADVKEDRSSVPPDRTAGAASATSKDLHNLEKQTAKTGPARTPRKQSALKLQQDKPNPPINFGKSAGGKAGMVNQGTDPYKGRLKQKRSHN